LIEKEEKAHRTPKEKKEGKKRKREGTFNTGRWQPEEHQRFIEALLKYGNDWKNVQKFVGTRSSTQARSHAQKFFVKIGKTEIENLSLDFENNSLKSLNLMANNLNQEQMSKAIRILNDMAFEKKYSGRKNHSDDYVDLNFKTENCYDFILNMDPEKLNELTSKCEEKISVKEKMSGVKRYFLFI
jgi:SHAQKYF class myb-like DNA-binding protein